LLFFLRQPAGQLLHLLRQIGKPAFVLFDFPDFPLFTPLEILHAFLQSRDGVSEFGQVLHHVDIADFLLLQTGVDVPVGFQQALNFTLAFFQFLLQKGHLPQEVFGFPLQIVDLGGEALLFPAHLFNFRQVLLLALRGFRHSAARKLNALFLDVDGILHLVKLSLAKADLLVFFQEGRLHLLQGGFPGFHLRPDRVRLPGDSRPLVLQRGVFPGHFGIALTGQRQFRFFHSLLYGFVLLCFFGLAGNGVELGFDFLVNVVESQDVLFGGLHLANGGILAAFILGHAGCIFDEKPAVFRFGFHQIGHSPLLHQGIGPGADTRAHEELFHVQQAAGHAVDAVLALAVEDGFARNGHFRQFAVNAREGRSVARQRHHDFRHAHRGGILTAVENHVVHLLAAQGFDPLFAHHPANRIDNI